MFILSVFLYKGRKCIQMLRFIKHTEDREKVVYEETEQMHPLAILSCGFFKKLDTLTLEVQWNIPDGPWTSCQISHIGVARFWHQTEPKFELELSRHTVPIMNAFLSTTNVLFFITIVKIIPETWTQWSSNNHSIILNTSEAFGQSCQSLCHPDNPMWSLLRPFILYDIPYALGWAGVVSGPWEWQICVFLSVACVMKLVCLVKNSNHFSPIVWILSFSH